MVIEMIDGNIEVGSKVRLKPEFDKRLRKMSRNTKWLNKQELYFGQVYVVKEIHLVHFVYGTRRFVVKLNNGVVESMSWFEKVT